MPRVGDPAANFTLLIDLGIITVPEGYVHDNRLFTFKRRYQTKEKLAFWIYDENITDANFRATTELVAGERLSVRVFVQLPGSNTTSEERLAFLARQGAIHTNAQGLSLVWEQKRDQLPKGYSYTSLDEVHALFKENPKDRHSDHGVPAIHAYDEGAFSFRLSVFEGIWFDTSAFLCVCREPVEAGGGHSRTLDAASSFPQARASAQFLASAGAPHIVDQRTVLLCKRCF